jgi:hypothetical protein
MFQFRSGNRIYQVGFAWVELDQFDFLEEIRWVKSKSRRVRSNYKLAFFIS